MDQFKLVSKSVLAVVLLCNLSACDNDTESSQNLVSYVEKEKQIADGSYIESITLTGQGSRLKPGQTYQIKASGLSLNKQETDLSTEVEWSSSNESIATIDNTGLITAILSDEGLPVTITAKLSTGVEQSLTISVSDLNPTRLLLKVDDTLTGSSQGQITNCSRARILTSFEYEDGYVSNAELSGVEWSIVSGEKVKIDEQGFVISTHDMPQDLVLKASYQDLNAELNVSTLDSNMSDIEIYVGDKKLADTQFTIGERMQLSAKTQVDGKTTDLGSDLTWSVDNTNVLGLSTSDIKSGQVVSLQAGESQLKVSCGGVETERSLIVESDLSLTEIELINSGFSDSIAFGSSAQYTLYANYSDGSQVNISEFATWTIQDSPALDVKTEGFGSDSAAYTFTATGADIGDFDINASFAGFSANVVLNVRSE